MKIISAILVTSLIGTALVEVAERMFGMVNVFMFAVAVTAIMGVVVVPVMQIKQRLANRNR